MKLTRRSWLGLVLAMVGCRYTNKTMITSPPLNGTLIFTPANQLLGFLSWSNATNNLLVPEYIYPPGEYHFTTIQPDGTVVDSTILETFSQYPCYSPDGSQIVYMYNDVTGFPSASFIRALWVMNSDYTGKTEILSGTYTDLGLVAELSWHYPNWGSTNKIVFQRTKADRIPDGFGGYNFFFHVDIWTCNPDGSSLTQLTSNVDGTGTLADSMPCYSPDGSKIVYLHREGTGFGDHGWDVWVMDADGSNPTQLTFNSYNNFVPPTWSPDGTKILYSTGSRGGADNSYWPAELWLMDADGSNKHFLYSSATESSHPTTSDIGYAAFSPDGNSIAIIMERGIWILVPGVSLRGYVASGGNLIGPGSYVV